MSLNDFKNVWLDFLIIQVFQRERKADQKFMSSLKYGEIQSHYEPFDLVTNIKEGEEGENITVKARGRRRG